MKQIPIPERLSARRKELGMTQKGLASAAGLSQQHVSAIETNKVSPELGTLERLADALGLELRVDIRIRPPRKVRRDWIIEILDEENHAKDLRSWLAIDPDERVAAACRFREQALVAMGYSETPRLQRTIRVVPPSP